MWRTSQYIIALCVFLCSECTQRLILFKRVSSTRWHHRRSYSMHFLPYSPPRLLLSFQLGHGAVSSTVHKNNNIKPLFPMHSNCIVYQKGNCSLRSLCTYIYIYMYIIPQVYFHENMIIIYYVCTKGRIELNLTISLTRNGCIKEKNRCLSASVL
jgi:hypothetical protein